MKLIVGLGNPGQEYENTRHNAGFMVMDQLAKNLNVSITTNKFNALIGTANIRGEKVMLMKPQTYMNNSGNAVIQAVNYYHIPTEDVLVIYDDMDLPCGGLRLREKGSDGGHNGMKSIIANLGTNVFPRIRVGIERHKYADVVDYVLGRFNSEQQPLVQDAVKVAAEAAEAFAHTPFNKVMNQFNGKKKE